MSCLSTYTFFSLPLAKATIHSLIKNPLSQLNIETHPFFEGPPQLSSQERFFLTSSSLPGGVFLGYNLGLP